MGEAPLVYPVMVYQRQADIAEQQNVIRDPGVSRRQRFRIHLASNRPWRDKRLQSDVLDPLRHIVGVANMVHQVLWRALPGGTPRHWAPPQLSQLQVAACHMPKHIAPDQYATKVARRRLFLPVLYSALRISSSSGCRHHMWLITAGGHLFVKSDSSMMETWDSAYHSHIVNILVQTSAVRNKHSNAMRVPSLQNTTFRRTVTTTNHPEDIRHVP